MSVRIGFLAVAWAALVAAAATTTMGHHGADDGFRHLNVDVRQLNATERRDHHLTSDEGPFREGWVFIVYGGVEGPVPVVVNLTFEGVLTDQWLWTPGAYHKNTTRLAHSGDHELTLWNPSPDEATRYAFYYDVSCNCAAKAIPLPGGFAIFNYDLPAGRDAFIGFPTLPGWRLEAAVATLDGPGAQWPDDFTILTEAAASGRGWLNLTFETARADRYYVFVEALEGASVEQPVYLTPLLEVEGAAGSAPGVPPLLAFVVAPAIALVLQRARRGRATVGRVRPGSQANVYHAGRG